MQAIAVIGYIAIGFVQLFATLAGLELALGTPTFINLLIATFLAWIPIIGTITGMYGAIYAWEWWWGYAALLFLWPYALWLLSMAFVGTAMLFGRRDFS